MVNGALYPFGYGLSYTTFALLEPDGHTRCPDAERDDRGLG